MISRRKGEGKQESQARSWGQTKTRSWGQTKTQKPKMTWIPGRLLWRWRKESKGEGADRLWDLQEKNESLCTSFI